MSEQRRSAKPRPYRMARRADNVDATRSRIVAATAELHGTVGPAATSIAAIAARAGVTRLTVYRHFPDEETLFTACSAHWMAGRVPPDPSAWAQVADPVARLEAGLADLYRFYRSAEPMMTRVRRDREALPESMRAGIAGGDATFRDVLLAPFARRGAARRRLRAAIGHAVTFETWRSLCLDQGLTDRDAVTMMVALVASTG